MNDSLRLRARAARTAIACGTLRGPALLQHLLALPLFDRDVWLDEALSIEEPPADMPNLPRGSVPYLPCGVAEIMAAVGEAPLRPDDEFVDLGSGVGRVAILAHLLSGARASGIEIQEHLVRSAQARCAALGLDAVSFEHADAAEAQLRGSVFFLYAPFNGAMLRAVLRRLEAVARERRIVVCAVDVAFPVLPWLTPRPSSRVSLTLYDSRAQDGLP